MSVTCLLWICAFITTIVSAIGKCPIWVPVLLITVAGLLTCLPLH